MTFYELFLSAKQGDSNAIDSLIEMYKPLITHYSFFDGVFDEDLHQEQLLRFLRCVRKFSLDFPEKCNKSSDPKRD